MFYSKFKKNYFVSTNLMLNFQCKKVKLNAKYSNNWTLELKNFIDFWIDLRALHDKIL